MRAEVYQTISGCRSETGRTQGRLSSSLGFLPCSCDSTLGLGLADAYIIVPQHAGTRGRDLEWNTGSKHELVQEWHMNTCMKKLIYLFHT